MSGDTFKQWLAHPAFGLVMQCILFAAMFGGMQVKLAEISTQLQEVKFGIAKLEDNRVDYAAKFARIENEISQLQRQVYSN